MHQAKEDLLVLAAQNGNQKAFNLICQRYHKLLLRYAFRICNDKETAKEATQDSWIKISKNIRKLNDPRALRSWLYRTVRWRTVDLMRDAKRYRSHESQFDEEVHGETKDEDNCGSEELALAINRLPSVEKQMIHLFYLDELRISEISAVLNIPGGTVKSRLHKARKLLKEKFDINIDS